MKINRYALLVENEIFDIISIPHDDTDELFSRWNDGFNNNPIGIEVTDIPDVRIGSKFVDGQIDNSEVNKELEVAAPIVSSKTYAMVSNDKVFIMIIPAAADAKMYEAAFGTNNVTGMDISNYPSEVSFGWVWNGTEFVRP